MKSEYVWPSVAIFAIGVAGSVTALHVVLKDARPEDRVRIISALRGLIPMPR